MTTRTPVSTSGQQWSITNVSTSTLWKPGQQELATQFFQTSIHNKPTGHTQDTHHEGPVRTYYLCVERDGLMQWQDGRGVRKVQQVVLKNSRGKSSNGKGKRVTEQPPNLPQCPPICPTSKGGWQITYPGKPTFKGADCFCGGWLLHKGCWWKSADDWDGVLSCSSANANCKITIPSANCWKCDPTAGDTRAANWEAKLNFVGQWWWWTTTQIQHQVMDNQYHARGNACMHRHHQAKVWAFSGQIGHPNISDDMVL